MIKYFYQSVPLVVVTVTVRLLTIEILATYKNYFLYNLAGTFASIALRGVLG